MRFSQRMGLIPIKVDIQKDGMDKELRIGLWNVFYEYIGIHSPGNDLLSSSLYKELIMIIWKVFLKKPSALEKAFISPCSP
ncbi:hypothetical protein C3E88_07255 [Clostridium sp. Cult3]|nr:hypothetical protein [Clostridium sp. Cult3]